MVVYLVQHAKALSKTQDPDRPLSDSGIADMALITAFIKPLCLEIDIIWHSSKTRARQTAKLLADVIDSPKPPYEHEGLEPDDDADALCDLLFKRNQDVMVVSHQPLLDKVARRLIDTRDESPPKFRQGAIVAVEVSEELPDGQVLWAITPEAVAD